MLQTSEFARNLRYVLSNADGIRVIGKDDDLLRIGRAVAENW
jgi:hypothetical protein